MAEFKEALEKGNLPASGVAVNYGASELVAKSGDSTGLVDSIDPEFNGILKVDGKKELATNIKVGTRFQSFEVLDHADARPWQLCHFLKSDGRFRIIVFADDVSERNQWQRVQQFGEQLAKPGSFIHRTTPPKKRIDSIIEVLMVHCAALTDFELLELPEIFHPSDEKTGYDYEKVFVDNRSYHGGPGEAYINYGVDNDKGCVVIVRPDQHVGWVGDLEDVHDMDLYFSKILIPQI
ncbi:hypothetical protein P7C71_g3200, partial [Lecanoromycetidae sp. Uapishka_2]